VTTNYLGAAGRIAVLKSTLVDEHSRSHRQLLEFVRRGEIVRQLDCFGEQLVEQLEPLGLAVIDQGFGGISWPRIFKAAFTSDRVDRTNAAPRLTSDSILRTASLEGFDDTFSFFWADWGHNDDERLLLWESPPANRSGYWRGLSGLLKKSTLRAADREEAPERLLG
jgi:hypothetical protein